MIGTFFLIKLTQFEKTGSIGKFFISQENLKNKFHFRNWQSITLFVTFTLPLFDRGVCFPFNKKNELNLKKKRKSEFEPGKKSSRPI